MVYRPLNNSVTRTIRIEAPLRNYRLWTINHGPLVLHFVRQETSRVSTIANEVAHHAGTNGRKGRVAHQKNGFGMRINDLVHLRDVLFVVEIGHIPDAAQYVLRTDLLAELHGEAFIIIGLDPFVVFKYFADPLHAEFNGEECGLIDVVPDAHMDFIEEIHSAFNYVYMPYRDRVEGARKQCNSFHTGENGQCLGLPHQHKDTKKFL